MSMKRSAQRGSFFRRHLPKLVAGGVLLIILIIVLTWLLKPPSAPPKESLPLEYVAQIRRNAEQNGLDPAYPAAVIMAESSYRPAVVSSANAQGLMQLLPETGEWVAGKLGETYEEGCLFDPETNIRYGCWFLGYLMRRYDGDMTCASSAYHQGPGTVDKWLADAQYSADGKTLTSIPSQATETYVSRILRYYERYSELYAA